MRARSMIILALSFGLAAFAPAPARALTWSAHFEQYDPADETFHFKLTFTTLPDWSILDANGYQRDSFQYWITWATHPENPLYPYGNPDVVIRGTELYLGGELRIRDAGPSSDDPITGGWGPIRGTVPWHMVNNSIYFDVPRTLLGDPDGVVSYYMLCGEFNAPGGFAAGITQTVSGPVPAEPGT
jgi:hypothetical protein